MYCFEDGVKIVKKPKLSHYKTLAKQGRLLELPAAIGTTVWFIENNFVIDYKVARIIINESGIDCIQVVKEINGHEFWNGYSLEEFNERFFQTKAEAMFQIVSRQIF